MRSDELVKRPAVFLGLLLLVSCGSADDLRRAWTGKQAVATDVVDVQDAGPETCVPDCANKECGSDGCGGSCVKGLCQICDGDRHCLSPWWTDPSTNLTWQNPPAGDKMLWDNAKQYCAGLSLNGGGWHLPTIGELRSLIRGCSGTLTGGACGVTDSCLSFSACWSEGACYGCSSGAGPAGSCYWPGEMQGKCTWFWTSSPVSDYPNYASIVDFNYGRVYYDYFFYTSPVRCVR